MLLLAVATIATSCSPSVTEPSSTAPPPPSTSTGTSEAPTTTLPETTTVPIRVDNPITNRDIEEDQIALMPLVSLPEPWQSFVAEPLVHETNAVAALRVSQFSDEAEDIQNFGRVDGFRTVHRPQGVVVNQALAVDSWVSVFADPDGAADYLEDYARDLVKDEDTGHGGALRVTDAQDFVVDELGDDALGLILIESTLREGAGFYETLVAFRIGRLLGFLSILRNGPEDFRVQALRLAGQLEERIVAVLRRQIVPEPDIVVPVLASYEFEYRQTFIERFSQVIFDDPIVVDTTTTTEPPPESTTTTETPPESTTTTTETPQESTTTTTGTPPESTTTTTRIEEVEVRADVVSAGSVVGEDLACDVTFASLDASITNRYVVVGDQAWRATDQRNLDAFRSVERDSEPTATDLIYCPGWSPDLVGSGLGDLIAQGTGVQEERDGIVTERFELGLDELRFLGLAPRQGAVQVDRFTVWLGGDGPWVVGVDLAFSGSSDVLRGSIGPALRDNAAVRVELDFSVSRINDPNVRVMAPPG